MRQTEDEFAAWVESPEGKSAIKAGWATLKRRFVDFPFLGPISGSKIHFQKEDFMPDSLSDLESRRADLVGSLSSLGDLRRGSIVSVVRRCGKPTCRCAQPQDPGHGPSLRLTHKRKKKTVTEALSTPAAVRKAKREVAEFRKFQDLSHEFVEVNEKICRLRPGEDASTSPQEKKRRKRSAGKSRAK